MSGRKVFTREVLSSADLNDLLMDQAVMRFATSSARAAAIPSPETNMLTMLDTNIGVVEHWSGTTWLPLNVGTPVAMVRQISASGVYTASTWGSVAFDAAVVDSHTMWAAGSPSRLTVPAGHAGTYEVSGTVIWNSVASASSFNTRIAKNGAAVVGGVGGVSHTWGASAAGYGQSTGTKEVVCAVGDYLELQQWCSNAVQTAIFADAVSVLTAKRIR
jgi:hypothetical protein